jgi:hypothetical protein
VKSKAVSQYLERHAEPEARSAASISETFGHALIVPAYGERDGLFQTLGSVPGGPDGQVLIVLVLNAREDSPAPVHEANEAARLRVARELPQRTPLAESPPITLHVMPGGRLLVIDRALPEHFLPPEQGVGLARKIGNDFALALRAAGRIASPWLGNTDADARLPKDYFEQLADLDPGATSAAIYFFDHRFATDTELAEAGRLYEISLRYYVLGLAWAGSPYAYQSMGSCLSIPADAYAAVRGFPKKNAAEDFYVLDKLAKVGSIRRLAGTPIDLDGRLSDRVPFGTGRALTDMTSTKRGIVSFRLYHPLVFAHLAAWLRVLEAIAAREGNLEKPLEALPAANPYLRADLLQETLAGLGAFDAVRDAIGRSNDARTLRRHLHTWFDAFRTLRFIHQMRDGGLKSLAWRQALTEAPFTNQSESTDEDSETLRKALAEEEKKLAATPAGVV